MERPLLRARTLLIVFLLPVLAVVLATVPTVPAALVTAFLLGAPALAVGLSWRTVDALPRAVVAVAASLTLNGLVAETMLAIGAWSPPAGIVVVGIGAALVVLGIELAPGRPAPRGEGVR